MNHSDSVVENEHWLRYWKGEAGAEDIILRQYQSLVSEIAIRLKRKLPSHVRLDDLQAAGHVGLWQAMKVFSEHRGVPFERFAAIRIRGAMLDDVRKTQGRNAQAQNLYRASAHAAYIRQQMTPKEEEAEVQFDWIVDDKAVLPEDSAIRSIEVAELNLAIQKLNRQEQILLSLVFVEGLNLSESAEVMDLSRSRIHAVYHAALKSLRVAMRKKA